MTVPGAVELLREIAPTLPGRRAARRRHGHGCGHGRARHRRRRTLRRQPGVPPGDHRRLPRHDVPAMPGCFTPTEILDAWDAGADIVKVFPATALGPGFLQGRARAAAAREVDADRRRDAGQCRRLASRRRRAPSASDRRWWTAPPSPPGVSTCSPPTRSGSWRASRRRGSPPPLKLRRIEGPDGEVRHLRRDHAAAEPAGARAAAAVAACSARRSAAAKPTSPSASRTSASRAGT